MGIYLLMISKPAVEFMKTLKQKELLSLVRVRGLIAQDLLFENKPIDYQVALNKFILADNAVNN